MSVVADFENKEDTTRHNNNSNNANNNKKDDDRLGNDWLPTASGNFLPNLKDSKLRERLMRLKPDTQPGVIEVTTLQQYKQVVAEERERLVCVRFYAPWCRACKAVARPFARLSKLYPNVKLVQVPTTKDNALLHQGLGVPSLPYVHLYHPEAGLVEERKISKEHFDEFKNEILKSYVDGSCPVEYDDDDDDNSDDGHSEYQASSDSSRDSILQ
jgi:thiol-disulfide isomerase/thioredoxin